MKKYIVLLCSILCVVILAACSQPQIESYKLTDDGNLMVIFTDGTTQDIGAFSNIIENSINEIEVNDENFYIINGIITDIKAKVPVFYELNSRGDLIVTYSDNTTENLGDFTNEAIDIIDTVAISDDGYYVLNGIKTSIIATEVFSVSFHTGYSATVPEQQVRDGYKVELPDIDRLGYTLDGWYCNNEKWSFNTDVVKNDMILTAVWNANEYNVSFVTGMDETINDMTIVYDTSYTLPVLSRDGYTFNGWEYNGRLVTEDKWSIANDCELIASWSSNKYEVTLNANGGTVVSDKVFVEYGKAFSLPVATNEYGVFIGWFYGEQQITDENGNSLTEWNYTENLEVTTPWIIELVTVEDLQQLYVYPNGHFALKNNIDISSNEWIPVGTDVKPFSGIIDGNGYAINGLKITELQGSAVCYGFIGKAERGLIHDIVFSNINISLPAIQNTVFVGGVIGYNGGAEISNVVTYGEIYLENHSSAYSSFVGGIAGMSLTDKISGCTNNASITAKTAAGGILGYKMPTAEINLFTGNCNNGEVFGAQFAGGMIGEGMFCFAIDCKNTGDITGTKYVGGLFGSVVNVAIIERSYNTGIITCTSDDSDTTDTAGGLVGAVTLTQVMEVSTSIANSYNQGKIVSDQTAGGIIGYCLSVLVPLEIQNCYNSGNIVGNYYVGGIAGMTFLTNVSQCVNFGALSQGSIIATICPILPGYTANITDCYYNCSTINIDSIQGAETTEKFAATFYVEQMFWDNLIWQFFEGKFPELR